MSAVSIVGLVAVLAVSVIVGRAGFVEISLVGLGGDIVNLLATVLFAAVVIERAVEVYINNAFDPEKAKLEREVTIAANHLEIEEGALEREKQRQAGPNGTADPKALAKLRANVDAARESLKTKRGCAVEPLAEHRNAKAAWAGTVATLLSLAAAAVGIRLLGQFLPTDSDGALSGPLSETCARAVAEAGVGSVEELAEAVRTACERAEVQLVWFRLVDVLLTTAVLAGGAEGIHQMIGRFKRPTGSQ